MDKITKSPNQSFDEDNYPFEDSPQNSFSPPNPESDNVEQLEYILNDFEQEDFIDEENDGIETEDSDPPVKKIDISGRNHFVQPEKSNERSKEAETARDRTDHRKSGNGRSMNELNPKEDPDYRRDSFDYPSIEKKSERDMKRKGDRRRKSRNPRNPPPDMNQYPNYRNLLPIGMATPNKDVGPKSASKKATPSKETQDYEEVRGLPLSASISDLKEVVFSPTNKFEVGEVVLVPRTRGGFSYGKITKSVIKKHCFFSPQVEHKNQAWKVVYPSNDKAFFKELPAPYIGKLKDGPHISYKDMEATMAAEEEEFELKRTVGEPAQFKDLQKVVFLPQSSFNIDEIVLVPRSSGGFTYGKISKETTINCRISSFSETHPLHSWRVIVSGDNPANVVRKDLIAGCIGKLSDSHLNATATPKRVQPQSYTTVDPAYALKKESELLEDEETKNKKFVREEREEQEDEVVVWGTPIDPKKYGVQLDQKPSIPEPGVLNTNDGKPLATSVSLNQVGGLLQVDKKKLFNQLMKPPTEPGKPLIVIDGPNVARKYGKDTEFSAKGIKITIDYWTSRGHDAVAFVPEHYVRRKPGQEVTLKEFMPRINNLPLLQQLIDAGSVILTPPQDYDDSYCIDYAMKHNGCIVTNDRYNDFIDKDTKSKKDRKTKLKWVRDHCISFIFVRDDFVPNPDFKFPPPDPVINHSST